MTRRKSNEENIRKIKKSGDSYAITLPVDWVKKSGLERIKASSNSNTNHSASEEDDPTIVDNSMFSTDISVTQFADTDSSETTNTGTMSYAKEGETYKIYLTVKNRVPNNTVIIKFKMIKKMIYIIPSLKQ